MNWYVAKLIFQIVCEEAPHQAQFDEQLRLVAADSVPEALAKARHLGTSEQEHFLNHRQQRVEWQFVGVTELQALADLHDGTELHYCITTPDDPDHYLRHLRARASDLTGTEASPRAVLTP
ncbi:protein of unknown function [Catalinimonas alkaloidigena]|uniref:DUF4288 domain-containing protein n=1 Tax=Catalinimonas alkaloidigena TaxID=1075417 RepID=A0A1G9H4C2_9BACT|nr:DUF4288 domain-containing protein [Catalinimonas alkaloidigena]SDL07816.1 protein of unknown function [Catalinimonas alkaloidigena]